MVVILRIGEFKNTEILKAGPLLVFQLLRYTYDRRQQCARKLSTEIEFGGVFPPLRHGEEAYDLRAVVMHEGSDSLDRGHYTAYVRDNAGDWYFCDDSAKPLRCSIVYVLQAEAYMLFYERHS